MTFTSLPEMFSSVFGPLAYTFSNAAETELFLEILSTRDGSRIGSKRFYNTPTGTLNIAPMVRKNIRFVPSSGMTGFCNSESRSASVQLAVGTTYSEVRTFVAAHDSVKPSRILTTMPSHRIIAYGESDEITCCIPGQHTVTVTSDITAEALTYNAIGGEELTLFRLNTRSFLPSVGTITVRIATAGQTVAEIPVLGLVVKHPHTQDCPHGSPQQGKSATRSFRNATKDAVSPGEAVQVRSNTTLFRW